MQMHVSICLTPLNLRLWPLWLGFGLKKREKICYLVIKICKILNLAITEFMNILNSRGLELAWVLYT